MELRLLNLMILIDFFFVCSSYSLKACHVINQESHVYS